MKIQQIAHAKPANYNTTHTQQTTYTKNNPTSTTPFTITNPEHLGTNINKIKDPPPQDVQYTRIPTKTYNLRSRIKTQQQRTNPRKRKQQTQKGHTSNIQTPARHEPTLNPIKRSSIGGASATSHQHGIPRPMHHATQASNTT